MSEWYMTLDGLWSRAWKLLNAGKTHRFVTLSTIAEDGPQSRLVVLRTADANTATLTIYTDATSIKVSELQADPRAALHHWTPQDDLQIRLNGTATVTTGDTLRREWNALPDALRESYGVTPPPGTAIDHATKYQRIPDFAQFAKINFTAKEIDIVHLSPDIHRRALFTAETNWTGQWRAP